MRWVCLFSGTIKIEMRLRRCQTHPHFVVNSKKSLVFAFNFHQSIKFIFTELWICKWQDYFDGFDTDHWIGFASRSLKLVQAFLGKCLKKRVVSYINGRPQKCFHGMAISTFCLSFSSCWKMYVNKSLPFLYRKKFHMKTRAPFASFWKSYSGGIVCEFAKRVHFLSFVTAFAELTYDPISLSLQTAENWVWIKFKYPQLCLWCCHQQCCERVLFPTRLEQYSNKKRHRTKRLWYICSKGHKGKRSEQFLWDNMHVKQQGKDFTIIPWCNEQQNAQLLQDKLTCKTRLCELKEANQRASRVKARGAKWREIQEWQEQSPQAKEVGGSRMQGTDDCERGQKSPEPKLS